MWKTPACAVVLLVALALPRSLEGQDPGVRPDPDGAVRVFGTVVDRTTGDPIPTARVVFAQLGVEGEPSWVGGSDEDGRFRTARLPLGVFQIRVEVLSFSVVSHLSIFTEEGDVDIRIEMVPVDFALDPVVVSARRQTRLTRTGFYDRSRVGLGHFVTRSEIEELSPIDVSDVLRRVPDVVWSPGRLGAGGVIRLRGGCEPQVILDGIPMAGPVSIDQIISPTDVEAIEVYHGATAPIQYGGRTTCGTVVMWSRDPGNAEGSQISLKKFLGAVGFVLVALFSTT